MTWCGHDHGQVNTKLCQKSSFPPSPTFLFLSKQYLLCSSQTVVPFKRHSVLLPSGPFFRLLWCLEPLQASVLKVLSSEWLCAIPLSPLEVFCTFPASAALLSAQPRWACRTPPLRSALESRLVLGKWCWEVDLCLPVLHWSLLGAVNRVK